MTFTSSPRRTSPGTIWIVLPFEVLNFVRCFPKAETSIGTLRYEASRHPSLLPTIPEAMTGNEGIAASQRPHACSNAFSKTLEFERRFLFGVCFSCITPEGVETCESTVPDCPRR